jgi:hypothetical protein
MKLTEELFTQEAIKIRKDTCIGFDRVYATMREHKLEILQKITGKLVSVAFIESREVIIKFTEKGVAEYNKYFLSEFFEKYGLTPGFNLVAGMEITEIKKNEEFTDNYSYDMFDGPNDVFGHENIGVNLDDGKLKTIPSILFGDDFYITLGKSCVRIEKKIIPFIYPTTIYYTSDKAEEIARIMNEFHDKLNTFERKKVNVDEIKVGFVYRCNSDLRIKDKFVKVDDITLDEFNTSLPNDKILNEIRKDSSGILIFHGEPGCGKSSYIKYLIQTCTDKNFIILSQDLLTGDMDKFRKLLLDVEGTQRVFIIEDCENLVKSRESVGINNNIVISDFLNITDGIYGDMFKMKFILTFNTDLKTIDPALLRKGRLKCKYKFEKLHGEKLKALAKKLGIEINEENIKLGMTLSDLYNYGEDNGAGSKKTVIGFK